MRMFPKEKYKYFTNNKDLVIAEQTYAGHKYRGKAHLGKGDTFNLEDGKDLASSRCDYIICGKRLNSIKGKEEFIEHIIDGLKAELEDVRKIKEDATKEYYASLIRLKEVENRLGLQ